jgi:hypothetical protein
MPRLKFLVTAMAAIAGATMASGSAGAMTLGAANSVRAAADSIALTDHVAIYVYEGRRFCFYPDGWHGPGWYRCGFRTRVGLGWGGPVGWQGWSTSGYRGGTYERGTVSSGTTFRGGARERGAVRGGTSGTSVQSGTGSSVRGTTGANPGGASVNSGATVRGGGAKVRGGANTQGGASMQGGAGASDGASSGGMNEKR